LVGHPKSATSTLSPFWTFLVFIMTFGLNKYTFSLEFLNLSIWPKNCRLRQKSIRAIRGRHQTLITALKETIKMKIKPLIALTAFAASMSAFAQAILAPAQAPAARRATHTLAERQALRKDVREFHHRKEAGADAAPHARPQVQPGDADVQGSVTKEPQHERARGAERHTSQERVEQRKKHREVWEARHEKREALQGAKQARHEKRLERRERHHQRAEQAKAGSAAAPVTAVAPIAPAPPSATTK
jgi:hypothetical protein